MTATTPRTPISPPSGRHTTTRERIAPQVAELHAQGHGRNQIAKQLGVSPSTVSAAAQDVGVTFDRAATSVALEVHKIDARARRTRLSARFLDAAEAALDAIDPGTPRDARDLAVVAGIATDKSLRLDEFESGENDHNAVDDWIAAMVSMPARTEGQ